MTKSWDFQPKSTPKYPKTGRGMGQNAHLARPARMYTSA